MIIHPHIKKRKKRKPNAKERQLAADWEALVKKHEPKKPVVAKSSVEAWKPAKSYIRETPRYPSLGMTGGNATKPIHGKVYTGTAMIGIGTLHKSNAVPIFNSEDAQDQAKMRR